MGREQELIYQLDSFDPEARRRALEELATLPLPPPEPVENVNLHFHSFFSYNAEGWSPSRIAWESHRAGLYAAGLCDFDVLDGLEEFLAAGRLLGLRATVNLETRAYFREYGDVDINSPGEPGVTYIMGGGFARPLAENTVPHETLQAFREEARRRNEDLVERINAHLPEIAIDYEQDVLPLTPAGGATERHIIRAYVNQAREVFGDEAAVARFWSGVLDRPEDDIGRMLGTPAHEELVRAKLAKRGGLGYVQPSEDTFPAVDDFIHWVRSCHALPLITWLDGTSPGESDARGMVEMMVDQGAEGLNIIPDRNWNVKDPGERAVKVANLREMVALADELGLPINIGTEMNRAGLPFADDLSGPVLSEFRESFLRGARIMVGHTVLLRYAGHSYATCGWERPRRNAYFEAVGALPPVTEPVARRLEEIGAERASAAIEEAVERGGWAEVGLSS